MKKIETITVCHILAPSQVVASSLQIRYSHLAAEQLQTNIPNPIPPMMFMKKSSGEIRANRSVNVLKRSFKEAANSSKRCESWVCHVWR